MTTTITKAHLVERLYGKSVFSKQESVRMVEKVFELVKKSLQDGEDVLISGFGKFCVRRKHQRRGRNPHTGAPIMLDPRTVVTFKCSAVLKEKMCGQ